MTIPAVASDCAERSYSKLKIIKPYLSNSIGQDKSADLALLSIEQEILKSINYKEIIDAFPQYKSRKKMFQYKINIFLL